MTHQMLTDEATSRLQARVLDTYPTLRAVIDRIDTNPCEPLTVDEMAAIANFSKFHFSRIFRNATGRTPGRYLLDARIAEAKRLLVETNHSVTRITNTVGFDSIGTFSARFAIETGLSPTEYRWVADPDRRGVWIDYGQDLLRAFDTHPTHPFARLLAAAVPESDTSPRWALVLPGQPVDLAYPLVSRIAACAALRRYASNSVYSACPDQPKEL